MVTRLDDLLSQHPGAFSISGKNLMTGANFAFDDEKRVESASTIKLLIMACLLHHAQLGKLDLSQPCQLTPEDWAKHGSGTLQHLALQQPVELRLLAMLMVAISDNVATNALIRLIGMDTINAFARANDLTHTELLFERLDFAAKSEEGFRLGVTTAKEMGALVEMIEKGEVLDERHTLIALSIMEAVQGSSFLRRIDARQLDRFGSKTGWLYGSKGMVLNECGSAQLQSGMKVVFSIFSRMPLDERRPFSLDSSPRHTFAHVAEDLFKKLTA